MSADEIRDVVQNMEGIVGLLDSASADDRKRVYDAAQLTLTYDPRTDERSSL